MRERALGSLKCERLNREPIDDALELVREADAFRVEFRGIRPHEARTWVRPLEVHQCLADAAKPTSQQVEALPLLVRVNWLA